MGLLHHTMKQETSKTINVLLLSSAFLVIFAGFTTLADLQPLIFESTRNKDSSGYVEGFTADGFTGLAMIYISFAVFNWVAPLIVILIGPKLSLILGGCTYAIYVAQYLYPMNLLLYSSSLLLGFGAALIWCAQGNFL